jgi:hypothetical protein
MVDISPLFDKCVSVLILQQLRMIKIHCVGIDNWNLKD